MLTSDAKKLPNMNSWSKRSENSWLKTIARMQMQMFSESWFIEFDSTTRSLGVERKNKRTKEDNNAYN